MDVRGDMDDLSQQETDELRVQKREAFARLSAVWQDALGAGIEPDVLAHVALFAALGDLVATYGETAVADFAERLPGRISSGEFTIPLVLN
ncbi:MAG: hypothetical protein M3453_16820 [Pseudomonadota bacterium]|jgi:hypothetical protein|nr:hypothetical protein [Pseudomonadota bacterium]